MLLKNRQVLLASRPRGEPTPDNFRLVEAEAPGPAPAGSARPAGSRRCRWWCMWPPP